MPAARGGGPCQRLLRVDHRRTEASGFRLWHRWVVGGKEVTPPPSAGPSLPQCQGPPTPLRPAGVLSTGHCHPRVVAALQQQAGSVIMAQQNIFPASRPMVDLLQRLDAVMPPALTSHFFCNSGAGGARFMRLRCHRLLSCNWFLVCSAQQPPFHPAPLARDDAHAAPSPCCGTEAVENAMKIARHYTGRQNIICFDVSWRKRGVGGCSRPGALPQL